MRSPVPSPAQHCEQALVGAATLPLRQSLLGGGHRALAPQGLVQELTPLMFDKGGVAEATLEVLLRRGGLLTEAAPGKVGFVYEAMAEPRPELGRLR